MTLQANSGIHTQRDGRTVPLYGAAARGQAAELGSQRDAAEANLRAVQAMIADETAGVIADQALLLSQDSPVDRLEAMRDLHQRPERIREAIANVTQARNAVSSALARIGLSPEPLGHDPIDGPGIVWVGACYPDED